MKAHINDEGTLVVEGENTQECMLLKLWEPAFEAGKAAFRIGASEPIQRAEEDVQGR